MRILLTGGTGLIGQALCRHWQAQAHQIWVLSRQPERVPALCAGARGVASLQELQGAPPFDAVVNLAGAPIADRPWTAARRELLWRSRVGLTRELVDWMLGQPTPPGLLLSGSATGWYGDRADLWLDEHSAAPARPDFGSRLCQDWEAEALRARAAGLRVLLLRTAPVLAAHGGMLARLLPLFRLGLGGRLGDGQQWMPWIHLDDEVGLIDHLLHAPAAEGVFNACAPEAVRNIDFTRALGAALHRPAVLPAPAWALRLALGEMSVLLLGGQRLRPRRAEEVGYVWRQPRLAAALGQLLARG